MKKRFWASLLSLSLLLTLLPAPALAAERDGTDTESVLYSSPAALADNPTTVSNIDELETAFTGAEDGGVIQLTADIGDESNRLSGVTADKDITLDLNGYTLYVTGNQSGSSVSCAITQTAGTLTVTSTKGNGAVDCAEGGFIKQSAFDLGLAVSDVDFFCGTTTSSMLYLRATSETTLTGCTFTGGKGVLNPYNSYNGSVSYAFNSPYSKDNTTKLTVTGCRFKDNHTGIALGLNSVYDIRITDSAFTGCDFGISQNEYNTAPAADLELSISGTTFNGNSHGLCLIATNYNAKTVGSRDVTITDCTFEENEVLTAVKINGNKVGGTSGAGIYYEFVCGSAPNYTDDYKDNLTITDCTFTGNHAGQNGGAIYIKSSRVATTATISGCTFTENEAERDGAALLTHFTVNELTIEDCTIEDSTSDTAAVSITSNGTTTLRDCEIEHNRGEGLHAYLESSLGMTLEGVKIDHNGGRGLNGAFTTLEIRDSAANSSSISNNSGGGLFFSAGDVTIGGNTKIGNNTSSGYGAGIYLYKNKANNVSLFIKDYVSIQGNRTSQYAGGIYAQGGTLEVGDHVILCNNTADEGGADIWYRKDVKSVKLPNPAGMDQVYEADGENQTITDWYKDFSPRYADADPKEPIDYTQSIGTGDVLLVAAYTPITRYDVTFDQNYDGAPEATVEPVAEGQTVRPTSNPTREGYKFMGWYTGTVEDDGSVTLGAEYDFDTPVNANLTLYAYWQLIASDITQAASYRVEHYKEQLDGTYILYETDFPLYGEVGELVTAGGKPYEHYTVNESVAGTVSSGTVVLPTAGADGEPVILTLRLYYDLHAYPVAYNLNGGDANGESYDTVTAKYDSTLTVKAAPTKPGYRFTGWSDGTNTYQPGDALTVLGDTTLTAQWIDTAAIYTVTYDLGTGNPADNRTESVHGGEPAPEFTPDGWEDHVFAGWYADQEKNEPYDFTAPVTKDVTIYAKWKQLKYTLRYGDGRPNDGEWGYHYAEGQTGYYVPGRPKPLPSEVRHFTEIDVNNPIYPGVTAAGWYFLSWMRFAEISEADIDPSRDVYVKNGDGWEELRDWQGSGETLYQYIAEGQTPDTDCGDVDYFAQWVLIQIDVEVDIEVGVSISGIGETHALVAIDDSQRSALAKNVNLATDVRDSNTEIKITAYVRNASSDAEIAALTARLDRQYSYGSNRIDYDVSVEKEITSDGRTEITTLKTLAEPIEIVFAVPDQWQGRGTVSMFRAHTDAGAAAVEKLPDLDHNAATYTIESDKFSTYAMIYVPAPVGPGGDGDDYCTLRYASNGGTRYKDERYAKNTVVQLDKVPVREGYQFTGWYADADLTQRITSIRMTGDRTVYAGWRKSAVPDTLNGDDHFAYVVGYADGTVRPDANISRSEVAAIFFRLLKPEIREDNLTGLSTFADVSEGMWYNKSVATMAKLGIVKGRPAGTFDPGAPITRGEFAAICARFDAGLADGDSSFTDISGHWAEAEIEHAAALGWIMGYSDGTFRPDSYITRAEAITMINRVLCRIPENESDLLPDMRVWPDNQPGTWYYLAVQEATNSHSFQYKGEIYEYWIRLIAGPDWTRYQD